MLVERDNRFWAWDIQRWQNDVCTRADDGLNWQKGWVQNRYEDLQGKAAHFAKNEGVNCPGVIELIKQHHKAGTMLAWRRREFEVDALVRELLHRSSDHLSEIKQGTTWGVTLPQSCAILAAQLHVHRRIRIIAEPAVMGIAKNLQEALSGFSGALELVDDVAEATHAIVVLTGGTLASCEDELRLGAQNKSCMMLYIYSEKHGWNFSEVYSGEQCIVKKSISGHEAQTCRDREHKNEQYEFDAMILELMRRMRV